MNEDLLKNFNINKKLINDLSTHKMLKGNV